MSLRATPNKSIVRLADNRYEFHSAAVEITIMDSRGRTVWQKQRWESGGPIRWEGLDLEGKAVEFGQYVCKILYPDSQIIYVPFVFIR